MASAPIQFAERIPELASACFGNLALARAYLEDAGGSKRKMLETHDTAALYVHRGGVQFKKFSNQRPGTVGNRLKLAALRAVLAELLHDAQEELAKLEQRIAAQDGPKRGRPAKATASASAPVPAKRGPGRPRGSGNRNSMTQKYINIDNRVKGEKR